MATKTEEKGDLIELPNGWALFYCNDDHPTTPHSYWRCNDDGTRGYRLTGVTTAIKPIDFEPDRLMKWAATIQARGVAMAVDEALAADDVEAIRTALHWLDPDDANRIWRELERRGLTYDDIREAKAVRGTNIHEQVLHALANGESVPDMSGLAPNEEGMGNAVLDFWLHHDPEVIACEQVVYSKDLGVAGRLDLMARLRQVCGDPHCPCHRSGVGLIDLKTGFWISEKEHTQVAMYQVMADGCGVGRADWTALLQVAEDGSYTLWEGEATDAAARSALDTYRHRGQIRNRIGKAKTLRGK